MGIFVIVFVCIVLILFVFIAFIFTSIGDIVTSSTFWIIVGVTAALFGIRELVNRYRKWKKNRESWWKNIHWGE